MERGTHMKLKGRVINGGRVEGEAFVLDTPFSFIGDFDPETGKLTIAGHPLFGKSLAKKVLVCPTGKGGTIAPFVAYRAWKNGTAPAAVLCQRADPILCESALAIDIPVLDRFDVNLLDTIQTGRFVFIKDDEVTVS
jgi:predicted aconitase with swiveling domain